MKMRKNRTMKRLAAWMLTLLMVLQTVPSLSNGDLSEYSSVTSDSVEGGKYAEVVFLGPDREPVESRQVEIGAAIGDLPEAPWRDSYIFDAWKAGDDSVTGETIAESNMEIVATYRSAYPALSAGYEDDTLSVTISAPEGAFPEGVTASLGSVSLSDAQRSAVFAAMGSTEEQELVVLDAIDISFLDENGNKVQPIGNVSISMNLKDKPAGSVSVLHLKDEEPAPVLRKTSLRKVAPLAKGASVANTASAATDSAAGIQGDVVVQNTTDSEFTFDASSFSVYAVVGDTSAKYVFHYPSDEYSFGNELNETTTYQMVAAGGRLFNPGAPTAPSDMDNPQFMGWWTKSGDNWNKQVIPANVDYVTTSAEGLTEGQQTVIDLYARFSGTYYIVYHNETNTDILATETTNTTTGVYLKENGTLRVELILTGPDSTNKAFLGWGKEPGKSLESDVVPEPFNFDVDANGTQHLYPVIADAYWITFDKNDWKYTENSKHKGAYDLVNGKYVLNEAGTGAYDRKGSGAEYVAPRFVLQGESYEQRYGVNKVPVTTRPGYEFKGWKYENGTSFDPSVVLTENICVYADWEAVQSSYTVQYWLQNANGDGYDLVDVDLKLWTGTTDTQTALTADTNLPYTEQDGTQLKLGNKYPHYKIHTSNNPDDPYRIINTNILGDESTVINVYYDCITYTLRFIYARSSGSGWNRRYQITEDVSGFTTKERSRTWNSIVQNAAACGNDSRDQSAWKDVTGEPGVTIKNGYVLGSFNSGNYTYYYVDITHLKYGEEILDVWPYNSLQNVGKSNSNSTYRFVSWGVQYDSPYHKKKYDEWNNSHADNKNGLFTIKGSYTKLDDMMINDNDTGVQLENGDVLANVLFGRYKTSNNLYQYQIYVEMLDADNVFSNTRRFTDGKTYKYYRTVENVTSTATLQEQAALAFEGFKLVGGPVDNQNNKTGATNCDVYFYYERERFALNIFRNHKGDTGTAEDDHVTKSIKYGEDISGYLSDENINPFADYVIGKTKYKAEDGEEFVFTGWYTVAEYVEDENLAQVDLTGKTMQGHLFIYAGWRPVRYRAWVQPNGGELSTSESTWFNLNYGEVIGSYEDVTRDYLRDENGDYIYVIYDHEDPRSAGYVKFNEATDEQKAHALRDGNNPIRYEHLKNAYALVGWHEVLNEDFGTYEQYYANGKSNDGTYTVRPPTINESDTLSTGAYVFGTPVTKDIAIRAIWRRAGTIAVEFLPTMQDGEETLTGTVPAAAAAKTADGKFITSYNDDGTVKESSASATKEQWIYPLSDQVYADLSNMQAQMAPEPPEGYYFVGWMTPYGVVVEPNNVFTIYADLARLIDYHAASDTPWYRYTLTAVYAKIKTVSLTYDFNAPKEEMEIVSSTLTDVGSQDENGREEKSGNTLTNLMLNHDVTLSSGAGFDCGPNYKLIGWSRTSGDSNTVDFELGETADFIDDEDTKLYAVWQPWGWLEIGKHMDVQEPYLDGVDMSDRWNQLTFTITDSNGQVIKVNANDGDNHNFTGIYDPVNGSDTVALANFKTEVTGDNHSHQYYYYVWLPVGNYTVTENQTQAENLIPGYKRTGGGPYYKSASVGKGERYPDEFPPAGVGKANISNEYRGDKAYLGVSKTVTGEAPGSLTDGKLYSFIVKNNTLNAYLSTKNNHSLDNMGTYTSNEEDATVFTIVANTSTILVNGFPLNGNGFIPILANDAYTVIEVESSASISDYDWEATYNPAKPVTVEKGSKGNIAITNHYSKSDVEVSVTKTFSGITNAQIPENFVINYSYSGNTNGTVSDSLVWPADNTTLTNTWTISVPIGKSITFTESNYEITGYNRTESDTTITHTVVADESQNIINFSNSYTPETTSVTVTKTWDDNNNQDGKRPSTATVQLYKTVGTTKTAVGEPVTVGTGTEENPNSWSNVWTDLPVYEGSVQIVYSVEETLPTNSEYSMTLLTPASLNAVKTNSGTIAITNSYTPETTSVTVTKEWIDDNNSKGLRTAPSITLSGKYTVNNEEKSVTIPEAIKSIELGRETEGVSWSNLPVYAEGGNEIEYTVSERAISGYTTTGGTLTKGNDGNYTGKFTNAIQQETVDVSGTKTWSIPAGISGVTIPDLTIKLYRDGTEIGSYVIISPNTTYSFTNLPKYAVGSITGYNGEYDGHEFSYTVSEVEPELFTKTAEADNSTNGKDFTNSRKMAQVYLGKQVTGNMGDRSATFHFTVDVKNADNTSITITGISNQDITRQHGNAISLGDFPVGAKVTIKETAVDGYTTSMAGGTIIENEVNTVTFTVSESGNTITFTNNKTVEVDTGVPMESKPYWLLLGLIPLAGLGVMLTARKRRRDEA